MHLVSNKSAAWLLGGILVCFAASQANAAYYVRLKSGSEMTGTLLQETPDRVVLDVGAQVITLPREVIEEARDLAAGTTSPDSRASTSSLQLPRAEQDADTGGIRFRIGGPPSSKTARTRTQIIDDAMAGIVLISNPSGSGSGFVVDLDGHIVTNYHVVRKEKYHTVTFFVREKGAIERRKIEDVELEARCPLYDLALLRVDLEKAKKAGIEMHPLAISPGDSLGPGDSVLAVGNPGMGSQILEQTVSEGIVSASGRNFDDILYVQTTAAVNPGNSGGPLLDTQGNVVGVVTLKAIFQEGIAFALPIRYMRDFLANRKSFAFDATGRNTGFRYLDPTQ